MYFLEGNVGTGKSTFLAALGKLENVHVTFEPVNEWANIVNTSTSGKNLLEEFYLDQPRYAYTFQSIAFRTRVKNLIGLPTDKQNIVERSILTDRNVFAKTCYETGKMNDIEWSDYNSWFDWLAGHVTPKGYIYLRADPEISYERIRQRNRCGEECITLSYLKELHRKHDDWLITEANVLILNVNDDFEKNEYKLENMIRRVKEFII